MRNKCNCPSPSLTVLLASLLDQLEWCLSVEPPGWRHSEPLSSPAGRDSWVSSALKEQAELLQCLLTYCQQRQPLGHRHLLRLVNMFTVSETSGGRGEKGGADQRADGLWDE